MAILNHLRTSVAFGLHENASTPTNIWSSWAMIDSFCGELLAAMN